MSAPIPKPERKPKERKPLKRSSGLKRGGPIGRSSPMKRSGKRIARHKAKHDVAATGERRIALARTQCGDETGAYCASPWCGRAWRPLSGDLFTALHEAHVRNVGMGRSRHAQDAEVNAESNRLLLCHACHGRFGRVVVARRVELAAEWKAHFEGAGTGHGARRSS